MVNIRKIQQTGGKEGSSFSIVLPKDWVSQQNLRKGQPVVVVEREDGCLIVDPRMSNVGETRSTSIAIEPNLRWQITSKYLLGFDEIRVISNTPISDNQRRELEQVITRFVSLEIVEENDKSIVLRCLVDPSRYTVRKIMLQMTRIASRMVRDAMSVFYDGDSDAAREVVKRDEKVDRLFFLIVRELRSAIQYPRLSQAMKITPVESLDFRLAAQYIERIADLAVDIAQRIEESISKALVKKLEPIVERVMEMLSKSVKNLFDFDSENVASVVDEERTLISETAKLRQFIVSSRNGAPQTQLYVVDSLLRMGEASRDIADLALPLD
ncbi:phosphate uptake regulator PhoU [Candidatus Thorarchaeota archaeon]|nr:MAG: phosphate uptake regulator PhoU [Candidatus Thorarchaeota archaeon]